MKLSAWAKKPAFPIRPLGDGSVTGGMRAERMATGTVIVHEEEVPAAAVVLYARVSSHEQQDQLTAHTGRNMPREKN
jgi:predicted site-specific integrase-resolvase